MPHDSSAIDAALQAYLENDALLMALLPDGVCMDEVPDGAKQYVLFSLFDQEDIPVFGSRAIESAVYLVKGVAMSGLLTNMRAVELRLDELLDNGVLAIPGYTFMAVYREERIRRTERDDVIKSTRWFHRGGYYRLQVSI